MEVGHLDHQHQREQYQHIFRLVEDRDLMVSVLVNKLETILFHAGALNGHVYWASLNRI